MIKKFVLVLCVGFSSAAAYAIPEIFPPNEEIGGPTTVCPGFTGGYSLIVRSGDFDVSSVTVSNNGTVSNSIGPGWSVTWVNNSTANVTSTMTVNYWWSPDIFTSPLQARTLSIPITIRPSQVASPGTPTTVSISDQGGGLFRFSSSSANASSYLWSVSGGSIEGSSTGSSINVRSTGCQISGSVRGRRTGQCGAVSTSSSRSFSRSIPVPARPGAITSTPFDGTRTIYRIDPVPGAFHYEWIVTGTNVQLQTASKLTTATVYCSSSTGTGTIRVRAVTSCGNSSYRSQEIGCGLGCGDAYPNPSRKGGIVKICGDSRSRVEIVDGLGNVLRSIDLQEIDGTVEISTKGLREGLYFLRYTEKSGLVATERILIDN